VFQHAPENGGMRALVIVTGKIQSFAHREVSSQMVWAASGFVIILYILYLFFSKVQPLFPARSAAGPVLPAPFAARHETEQMNGIFTIPD
ncbi:MAG: hypothetical protein J5916_03995, partial [Oscillospiraceae bacterium]|nr:hypothetical protein [Oscillospiraceae bacterium]